MVGRLGRACVYHDFPVTASRPVETQVIQGGAGQPGTSGLSTGSLAPERLYHDQFFAGPLYQAGPLPHTALLESTIQAIISTQALKTFASGEGILAVITTYFDTIHERLPIISKQRFHQRWRPISVDTPADFTALCMCINLILQFPSQEVVNMQSSLYMTVKSIISLLESTNYVSVELVQCRLLVSFYEIGHGIFPASSISIGACARTARALGLNKRWLNQVDNDSSSIAKEEEKRVWWAVFNLDR